jgi:hypothetical protein
MRARVVYGDREHVAGPDQELTFGRSRECTICLDPDDVALSRIAGKLDCHEGIWWLTNTSGTRPLSVVDELGLRNVLPPGRRTAIEAPTRIVVDGAGRRRHSLLVEVEAAAVTGVAAAGTGLPTATGAEVLITEDDRLAMVALFAGYLEDPSRYDPRPRSYLAAGARLNLPDSTVRKRIEYLRTRLDAAGVPNMTGPDALVNLAEYAIARRLVTREDLALLRR